MSEAYICDTTLDNPLWFRLSRIKETEDFFTANINGREKIGKALNRYITGLNYTEKSLLVLSCPSSGASLCSCPTVIGTPFGIVIASSSPVFLINNMIVKMFLNTMERQKTTERLLY